MLGILSIISTMERNPFIKIKNSFSNYAVVMLGLSGVKPESYQSILASLASKSLTGRFPSAPIAFEINVRFKHMEKIKREKDNAIRLGILTGSTFYPATITANGQIYRARIRLKGDLPDHWTGLNRWSFRIRIKDGQFINGMSQFSIHKPLSRQVPDENMFQAWLRAAGNITPRHEYARVTFNGDDWGIMNVEEHMTKHLLERNSHKESPIFKVGSEDNWVFNKINTEQNLPSTFYGRYGISLTNARKYTDEPRQVELFSYGAFAFREWLSSNRSVAETYSIDQLSRAVIAAAVWQNAHGIAFNNMRLNLNPYSLKLQPITADQGEIRAHSDDYTGLVSGYAPFIGELLRSDDFYANLDKNIKALKDAIPAMHAEQKRLCAVFVFDCPKFKFDVFDENFRHIDEVGEAYFRKLGSVFPRLEKVDQQSALNHHSTPPNKGVNYNRHILGSYFEDGRLVIWNLLPHDVTLIEAQLHCKNGTVCSHNKLIKRPINIPAGFDGVFPHQTTVQLPANIHLDRNHILRVTTRLGEVDITEEISLTHTLTVDNPLDKLMNKNEQRKFPAFISATENQLTIKAGNWEVTEPILIAPNQVLVIDPGTTLRFTPDAYILGRGSVVAKGSTNLPIILTSAKIDKPWAGIHLIQAPGTSIFSHTRIENTRHFDEGVLVFTGAVTFYESDVVLNSVTFNKSVAEDALNIVRSTFAITLAKFRDTRSDAFDSDFSEGVITKSSFERIGGDGLDTSGSQVRGTQLRFEGIGDKAISSGEASRMTLNEVNVDQAYIGVASKDGSHTEISHYQVSDTVKHAAMIYIKKAEYGPANLILSRSKLRPSDIEKQNGNVAWLNGHEVEATKLNVEALYENMEKRP